MIAFSKDLVTNPATRNVHDVRHEIVAAASSTSKDRAAEFLTKVKAGSNAKPYGSYHELVADPDVQIVYVATPHSHHFQNAMLALEAGKHVLCEKSLTINASQARKLVATAKEKKLFFMEAVWTRYFPLSIKVRELIKSGTIGNVYRVIGKETEFLTHPSPSPSLCPSSQCCPHLRLLTLSLIQPICPSTPTRETASCSLSPTPAGWSTSTSPAAHCSISASTP